MCYSDDIEPLCIEISNKKAKNIILNSIYRSPKGGIEVFENFCKDKNDKKDYERNKKVQNFLNFMFCYNMIPAINKPTRVTRNTATAIDHIITNSIIGVAEHKSAIIKRLNRPFSHNFCTQNK